MMTLNPMTKTLCAAVALSLSGLTLTSVVQAETRSYHTAAVAYGDLNLASEAGQATLQSRIKAAVRRVCGSGVGRATLSEVLDEQRCHAQAMASAKRASVSLIAAARSGYSAQTSFLVGN
jgi:UrcA family protein